MTQNSAVPKAIPTRYAGYHFRSRLEARWAVFFDSLGKRWEYEPQGYELPSGNYLPDFRVEDWFSDSEWLEVKGRSPDSKEIALLGELCASTKMWGSFLGEIPNALSVIPCEARGMVVGSYIPIPFIPPIRDNGTYSQNPGMLQYVPYVDPTRMREALIAARSARFEHGWSGAS